MYACLHVCLSTCWFNYYFFLDGCEEFETYFYTIFQNCLFVFLPILCIDTVSYIIIYDSDIHSAYYLTCYYLTPDSCMLTPDSCLLSPDTCLISLITCHLTHYCLPCDYHISEILPAILYYICNDLYFLYLCTPVTPEPSCLCYSCKYDTYIIINYKKDYLYRVRGKLMEFKWWICL